jgi:hypothetical protein
MIVYKTITKPETHWIALDLKGTISNKSAIGAVVKLHWNGQTQSQVVNGGTGFCSQNQRRIQFGLGNNDQVNKITISWPSGKVTEIVDPQIDMIHKIVEPGVPL